ncbi:2-succinyl-5-enolpyruvyl-6-hydroxy-3-cyclohexene-1-carboxylic-acid synthase [Solicola gregarius]|uniref:2-succinyl-5-enolpyruvyl-6-hydroxy-3-cyclohexene-1-carboxylate synthase n=1 Tax=Solicola gregarius TaxID=2908642 RepID=A0AA46TE46_9ACTN|nr:2-succinyl-5-enolpyruvyl-6-hydroxy-3-cyclohexene-1-carboxylic-acid synthase [Solicola gregarius]UYM03667.1 2-succinyl-5-enolpyruvyl-6-hydroxy-3-cyclohexene-1-carboxylic-acid synthase [Solicola gregarius]
MSAATAVAHVVVDELVRFGVRDAVVSPGSRSAPLAYALHEADRAGRLRLHVRVDERSAGFLSVGLAKGSHRPVPVVTTSGTAVANLHPAVLEAAHSRVPLIVVSADRPAELRDTGANQTTDQVKLFGDAVVRYAEIPAADVIPASSADWRSVASRTFAAGRSGPVHLNVCLREPLAAPSVEVPPGRPGDVPWTAASAPARPEPVALDVGPRTVVVAGDDAGPPARVLAQDAGWPLFAEPTSGSRTGTRPIATYRLLLGRSSLAERIERVVVYGHPTLSRPVTGLLDRADVEVVVVAPHDAPVVRGAARVVEAVEAPEPAGDGWLEEWTAADAEIRARLDGLLSELPGLTPWAVARAVSQAVPPEGLLVVGSSSPVRDLDLMARAYPVGERRMVMANRGLAGIDGTISTAIGAALGRRSSRSLAYVGDLTFLHDSNGLLLGPDEPRPDLTIVVANDDGGSIFATLEQGAEEYADAFERIFGTPTGVDLGVLCASMGVAHQKVDSNDALVDALARIPDGIEVVEAVIGRGDRRVLDGRIRGLVD